MTQSIHESVLTEEVIGYLRPRLGQTFVDGTLGGGGHTRRLAEAVGKAGQVIAIDRDLEAVRRAEGELANLPVRSGPRQF